jgi:hypothetical protein
VAARPTPVRRFGRGGAGPARVIGEDGSVKTRTLLILAILTGALILGAGILQIILGRYVQN